MARAAHALEQRRDRAGRAEMADQIDVADVDAQLERGSRDHDGHVAGAQPLLGREADPAGQAAVVRVDASLSEPLGQLMCHALGEPARVDEHERRAMGADERRHAIVDRVPHLVCGDRPARWPRHLDPQFPGAAVSGIDDCAVPRDRRIAVGAHEEARDRLDRFLGRAEPDALAVRAGEQVQPLERECEVAAPLVPGHRVDLVDDHRACGPEKLAAPLGGEQQVQGLRRRDQDVGRALQHARPLPRRGVARAHRDADLGQFGALGFRDPADLRQRFDQVALDVVAERLERRDVHHRGFVPQAVRAAVAH